MLLGHTTGLDDNYFRPTINDIVQEYLKAVNLLTIYEENRLKLRVEELTEKTKNAEFVIYERLQEKDKEIQYLRQKNTDDIDSLRQDMENKFNEQKQQRNQEINRLLSVLVKEGKEGITVFSKKTFEYLKNEENARLSFSTTDCEYNDPIFFDAPAKDILIVKKEIELNANNTLIKTT